MITFLIYLSLWTEQKQYTQEGGTQPASKEKTKQERSFSLKAWKTYDSEFSLWTCILIAIASEFANDLRKVKSHTYLYCVFNDVINPTLSGKDMSDLLVAILMLTALKFSIWQPVLQNQNTVN